MADSKTNKKHIEEQNVRVSFIEPTKNGKRKGSRTQIVHFDSFRHMTEVCINGQKDYGWTHNDSNKYTDNEKCDWRFGTDFENHEETTRALVRGENSESVMRELDKLSEKLDNKISGRSNNAFSIKRKRRFSEEGSELDIDRLMGGDPQHWSKMSRNQAPPVVKLYVSISANAGVDESDFNKAAALIIFQARALEKMGFSTEIIAITSSRISTKNGIEYFSMEVPVKKASERLDVQRVSTICLPGIFRQFTFDCRENLVASGKESGGSGSSMGVKQDLMDFYGISDGNLIDVAKLTHQDYFDFSGSQLEELFKSIGL